MKKEFLITEYHIGATVFRDEYVRDLEAKLGKTIQWTREVIEQSPYSMSQSEATFMARGKEILKEVDTHPKAKQLVDGLIPAHTVCPYDGECLIACVGNCRHKGSDHSIPYSCASARAFKIIKEVGIKI